MDPGKSGDIQTDNNLRFLVLGGGVSQKGAAIVLKLRGYKSEEEAGSLTLHVVSGP